MAASPNMTSRGDSMKFTQSEATAAQRTWSFYLSNSADGTAATGKTIATTDFQISKAGGAFGNATGTVTEISLGFYKMVFAAADLDTLGDLAFIITESGVDTLVGNHQIVAFDLNTATVVASSIGTGGIATTSFAAGAIDAAAIAADAIGSSELAATAIAEIADAVWDETLTSHTTTNTFGLAVVQGSGAAGGNSVRDNFTYDSYGMATACRLRLFDTAANAEAATLGGSAETGTLATFTIAASGANGRVTLYRSSED